MNCREFRRRFSDYRDGHDPELAALMDDHLESCHACAAFDRAFRAGVDLLRIHQLKPTSRFMERLARRIGSEHFVPEPLPPRISPWVATIAAGFLLALVGLSLKELMVLPPPVAAEVQPMVIAQPRLEAGIPFVIFDRISPSSPKTRPPSAGSR